jgi:hypothetical protein
VTVAGEGHLFGVADVLVAEEDDLPREQALADGRHGGVVELGGEVDAVDLGTDVAGHRPDVEGRERCGRVRGRGDGAHVGLLGSSTAHLGG